MPNKLINTLNMSLVSRLFVFIALEGFTFCYLILCFIIHNTRLLYWYYLSNTIFLQKCLNIYLNFRNAASKKTHIILCWGQFLKFSLKHLKCTLQKSHYSKKLPEYGLKVHSDYLNIQKSYQKQSQALKIYSTSQLFFNISRALLLIFQP